MALMPKERRRIAEMLRSLKDSKDRFPDVKDVAYDENGRSFVVTTNSGGRFVLGLDDVFRHREKRLARN